jgi:glycosyltransferase involved in cell wall biosynthesis
MHLLVITNNPNHASFRQRIGIHLDVLRSKGIDSTVVRLPKSILGRRRLFASAKDFDGTFLHRKTVTALDGFWLRRFCKSVIYDFDDAIMYSGRDSRIRLCRFHRSVTLARLVLAGNDYLAEHARRCNGNVQILPTGLDLRSYRVEARRNDDGLVRLVWIGGRSTLKYLEEMRPVLDRLGERFRHVVLRIICNDFLDLRSMKVEKRDWSSDTEATDLITGDIGLAPLPDDRFTRGKCGFKVLQYQAAGLPVVASPVGVNAHYVQDGVTGFLARDAEQWVGRLSGLIENPELRTTLGRCGRREVEQFDASVIGNRLSTLIAECLGQRKD